MRYQTFRRDVDGHNVVCIDVGDYSGDIHVFEDDELGELAAAVCDPDVTYATHAEHCNAIVDVLRNHGQPD